MTDLVDNYFQAYNAGRLREACHLFAEKILSSDGTVGMSITGALTPAGLGGSCIVPLMKAGFIDWLVSTGANLYHDTHFAIGHSLHRGSPFVNDVLYYVINTRYNDERTTIFTTNHDDLEDRIGKALRSRLSEMCEEVRLIGVDDYRAQKRNGAMPAALRQTKPQNTI